MPGALIDDVGRSRFELEVEGATALIDYRRSGNTLYLNHAEVPAALGGRGLGTRLVRETLDVIRARGRGERVVPVCPFIRSFIERNPGYADLCAP